MEREPRMGSRLQKARSLASGTAIAGAIASLCLVNVGAAKAQVVDPPPPPPPPVNNPPTASLACSPCTVNVGQTITFDARGSSDPEGPIASYRFSGARATAQGSVATQTYTRAGSFSVSVTVTDGGVGGAPGTARSSTASVRVTVLNRPPIATFRHSPDPFQPGQSVTLDASASRDPDPGGRIARYEWDLTGDGGFRDTGDATGTTVSLVISSARRVGLRVIDRDGGVSAQIVQTITPGNAQPVAGFAFSPAAVTTGQTITFSSTSTEFDGGSIVAWAWDLDGDGAFDDGSTPTVSRAFATPGSYTVSLRVTDNQGASTVAIRTLSVTSPSAGPGAAGARGTSASALSVLRPFPVVRLRGYVTGRGAQIRLLAVRAPVGARVIVRCRGRSCAKRSQALTVRGSRSLRFTRYHRYLRAGTILEVAVTRPGTIGKHVRFMIRKNTAPLRKDSCMRPGARTASRCPAG